MLEQLREKLLEQNCDLLSLLKAQYPDADAVLGAIVKIEFLMQDQPKDISDQGVTARVKADDGKRFISNLLDHEVRVYPDNCVSEISSSCCIPLSGANRLSRKKRNKEKEKEKFSWKSFMFCVRKKQMFSRKP